MTDSSTPADCAAALRVLALQAWSSKNQLVLKVRVPQRDEKRGVHEADQLGESTLVSFISPAQNVVSQARPSCKALSLALALVLRSPFSHSLLLAVAPSSRWTACPASRALRSSTL